MATQRTTPETSVQLRRTFAAPRQKVFRAWTDPEELTKWFAPGDDFTTKVPELDLRPGGSYRIEMHSPAGNVHCVVGTYREVSPPNRLVYTWRWLDKDMSETLVTVEFHDRGGQTEVVLTHELFPTPEWREQHAHGWNGCLARLERLAGSL